MKSLTKNSSHSTLHIGYKEKYINKTENTKFHGIDIDKFSGACYSIRSMVHISNINTLKSISNAYLYSTIKYGKMFWGNSSKSGKIFTLQKKIFRIIAGAQAKTSCGSLFKLYEILPVLCQYILSFMNCIMKTLKQINLYTILIQGISIIFIDQMTTYLVFKKAHSLLASKFSTVNT